MIAEVLHGTAIVSTALGACCIAAERRARPARIRDAVMAVGMVAAMVCTAAGWGSPVLWSAAVVAIAFAVLPFAERRGADDRLMVAFDALGAVIMAALMLVMSAGVGGGLSSGTAHHGTAPLALAGGLAVAVIGYTGFAAVLTRRVRGVLARMRPLAMGGSVLLMGIAALAFRGAGG